MKHKICPNCKSGDVTLDMGGQSGKYICRKCKYIGVFFTEIDTDEKKKKK
jgi:RNA polymerase subunit RPABC4/transcription elongation factor Spt4